MSEFEQLLQEVFRQYGLLGLFVVFVILGPGFTYFRTRAIRVQAEAKAQVILNAFAQMERERSERLEKRLDQTLRQLNLAEDEVANLRLRLAKAQSDLDDMPLLKRRIRRLTTRVNELETQVKTKQTEIERLQHEHQHLSMPQIPPSSPQADTDCASEELRLEG